MVFEPESKAMSKPDQTSQSEQRTGDDEFQNLARQYFSSIYRLALATLQDSEIARRATEQTLVSALLDFRHRQSSDEIKLWLFSLALRVVHGEERRLHRKPVSQTSAEKWETGLWQMVDGFGAKEHDLCLLYYLLGFKIPEIAALLHVGQSAVRAQLEIFRGKFKQILAGANIRGSKEVAAPGTTGVPPSKEKAVEFQEAQTEAPEG